jgi:hypothetical protein
MPSISRAEHGGQEEEMSFSPPLPSKFIIIIIIIAFCEVGVIFKTINNNITHVNR